MAELTGGKASSSVNSGKLSIEQGNNRLLVNDGTNDRLLLGEENSGDIVVKLSQSGYDVKEATDQQLIMSSEFNSFKIVSKQNVVVSKGTNSNSAFTNYTHNLGYVPAVVGYCVASWNPGVYVSTPFTSRDVTYSYQTYMTATTVQCRVETDSVSSLYTNAMTVNFYIYILAETIV